MWEESIISEINFRKWPVRMLFAKIWLSRIITLSGKKVSPLKTIQMLFSNVSIFDLKKSLLGRHINLFESNVSYYRDFFWWFCNDWSRMPESNKIKGRIVQKWLHYEFIRCSKGNNLSKFYLIFLSGSKVVFLKKFQNLLMNPIESFKACVCYFLTNFYMLTKWDNP